MRLEWSSNPQYSYGWIVPILCLGLLLRRWYNSAPPFESNWKINTVIVAFVFGLLAFLYLPTRLIEMATPEWRPVQWSLGLEAVGLTLCAVYVGRGRTGLEVFAFPVCFFLVAIPWPSLFETPAIQLLTRASCGVAVELLGWSGIPAVQHGNVIEISSGVVGVEEACSGIRSFQTSLMVSLFFGEFYRMVLWQRLLLIPLGAMLAMLFNVCRVCILTAVAAEKGLEAIHQYHDPAGLAITLVCTGGLFAVAWTFHHFAPAATPACPQIDGRPFFRSSMMPCLGIALCLWLVTVEIGVGTWYRIREAHLKLGPDWRLEWPRNNPSFQSARIDHKTQSLLRFDEGSQGVWTEVDGKVWRGFYFSWKPGRVAGYLAKRHEPEICLPATGNEIVSGPNMVMLHIRGITLPVRSYIFKTDQGLIDVFHCRWENGATDEAYVERESARLNLVRSIWAGRGKQGQKVFELVVQHYANPREALADLESRLEKAIQVESNESHLTEPHQ